MRIILLGHEDIASLIALHSLVSLRPEHEYTVYWSGPVGGPQQAAPDLEALAATDRALFEAYLTARADTPIFREAEILASPNSEPELKRVRDRKPDLVVSVRYRKILREEFIGIPAHGVLNLHSGILPDYRGVMATFWAMLAGETEIGTTLHWIVDAGIDTGPVIGISRQAADYEQSYLENVLGLYPQGCGMIADALDAIDMGRAPATVAQETDVGSYYSAPTESDVLAFMEAGGKMFSNESMDPISVDILSPALSGAEASIA